MKHTIKIGDKMLGLKDGREYEVVELDICNYDHCFRKNTPERTKEKLIKHWGGNNILIRMVFSEIGSQNRFVVLGGRKVSHVIKIMSKKFKFCK